MKTFNVNFEFDTHKGDISTNFVFFFDYLTTLPLQISSSRYNKFISFRIYFSRNMPEFLYLRIIPRTDPNKLQKSFIFKRHPGTPLTPRRKVSKFNLHNFTTLFEIFYNLRYP